MKPPMKRDNVIKPMIIPKKENNSTWEKSFPNRNTFPFFLEATLVIIPNVVAPHASEKTDNQMIPT